jgi:hypothetical protein
VNDVPGPGRAAELNELGVRHALEGEWGPALECFEAALAADPRIPELWANLALAAHHLGDLATADGAQDVARTLDPGLTERCWLAITRGLPLTVGEVRLGDGSLGGAPRSRK